MLLRVLCVLALSTLGACAASQSAEPPPPLSVEVVRVSAPSGARVITATGSLEREREMALSFRIPGVLRTMTVDDGDAVRAGQTIAAIDATQVTAGARQAEAALERARRDLARDETLAERGYVSEQRLADRRTAVATAKAAYDAAAFDRRWANLVSPVSGVVLQRRAQAGEVVQPGQPVVLVADESSPLVLRAFVTGEQAARLRAGSQASVRIAAERTAGVVTRVGERVEAGTGMVPVEIRVPTRPGLRSGLIGTAELRLAEPDSDAGFERVPAEAILEADGRRAFVYRLDEAAGAGRRTQVAFGGFDGDAALVAGLPPGSAVVTAGAGYLADGQKVTVVRSTVGTGSKR